MATNRKHTKKEGPDGLTERERAFAVERRRDPTSPYHVIAERAGFAGNEHVLNTRARLLMKKPAVLAIIHAPDPVTGPDGEVDESKLKAELRRTLLAIVRGRTSDADKIRAIDKLLCTIEGAYVPVQVDVKGKLTMEGIVRAMGGAPGETQEDPKPPQLLQGADA